MLWDPKKDLKPAVDPTSVAGLVAWLEAQPADDDYCYVDTGHCMISRYMKSLGYPHITVGGQMMWHGPSLRVPLPEHWNDIAKVDPHTFGAALIRARAFL